MSLLSGKAIDWASAVWETDSQFRSSFEYLLHQLSEVFEYPEGGKDISMQLLHMSQGNRTAADFPSGKDPWNQWTTYTLTLLQLEQTTDLSGRRGTGPPTEPGFSQGFFSILSPMEFSFLAAVASGLLSWGHFISSTIIDLIAQILFKLN